MKKALFISLRLRRISTGNWNACIQMKKSPNQPPEEQLPHTHLQGQGRPAPKKDVVVLTDEDGMRDREPHGPGRKAHLETTYCNHPEGEAFQDEHYLYKKSNCEQSNKTIIY